MPLQEELATVEEEISELRLQVHADVEAAIEEQGEHVRSEGEGPGPVGVGLRLQHGLQLLSGCGDLPYTNYVQGFVGALDWIFADARRLRVRKHAPLPDHEAVVRHVALPSAVFPSDHLPIAVELEWHEGKDGGLHPIGGGEGQQQRQMRWMDE